jgi:hypothetical protein
LVIINNKCACRITRKKNSSQRLLLTYIGIITA